MTNNHNTNLPQYNDPSYTPTGCIGAILGSAIAFLICTVITLLAASCTHTQYLTQEVPVILHDTITTTTVKHDSIHHRDSIYLHVYTTGDTVHEVRYLEHWNTHHHTIHDTVYELQLEPFEKIITKTVEVPAPLTKNQLLLMRLGEWMIATIILVLIAIICYLIGKRLDKAK